MVSYREQIRPRGLKPARILPAFAALEAPLFHGYARILVGSRRKPVSQSAAVGYAGRYDAFKICIVPTAGATPACAIFNGFTLIGLL
jgi:hypothetical protein